MLHKPANSKSALVEECSWEKMTQSTYSSISRLVTNCLVISYTFFFSQLMPLDKSEKQGPL